MWTPFVKQRCVSSVCPTGIRTDNGTPFATMGLLGLSKLSIKWLKLGIVHERITPGEPQQNGRHERMHRAHGHATGIHVGRATGSF